MEVLKIYDSADYTEDMSVFEKFSVRAVIIRDGKIATQKGASGEYKILGGGVDANESFVDALAREVLEESGLIVIKESAKEIGEFLEMREDLYTKGTKYVCHSYFYFCDALEEMGETHMTASEIAKGYHLEWATPEEIVAANQAFDKQPWINRDTDFVKMLLEGKITR